MFKSLFSAGSLQIHSTLPLLSLLPVCSILGSLLFFLYTISRWLPKKVLGFQYHLFTGHPTNYTSCYLSSSTKSLISNCLPDICSWMFYQHLRKICPQLKCTFFPQALLSIYLPKTLLSRVLDRHKQFLILFFYSPYLNCHHVASQHTVSQKQQPPPCFSLSFPSTKT